MERILIGDPAAPASEIVVSRGLLPSAAAEAVAAAVPGAHRVAILTQPGAAPRARELRRSLAAGGVRAEVRVVPDRDAAKTFIVAEEVYLWLNELALKHIEIIV